jgi:hypothetical protein
MAGIAAQALRERVELAKAMKDSKFHLAPGECDYVPPLELLGIFISHATVHRMVLRGELDMGAAMYLNATLGCHNFCVLHHCTHESISQHNDEHAALENTTFRLACVLNYFFDDGYREAHRMHHMRPNQKGDPDIFASHTSLASFGHILFEVSKKMSYVSLGAPFTPLLVDIARFTGITDWVLSSWIAKRFMVNWKNVTHKVVLEEGFKVLDEHEEYRELRKTLQGTWHGARALSIMLLGTFFARMPHRHGLTGLEDGESFHDTVFRGQRSVDLWMMGEGQHQMHHAKPDVAYSRLQMVARDVEARRPDLVAKMRGNGDVAGLEYGGLAKALHMRPGEDPVMDFPIKRTECVLEGKDQLRSDVAAGLETIASGVLDASLHVCANADCALLRRLVADMGYPKTREESGHVLPMASWNDRVFCEDTVAHLAEKSTAIKAEVAATARLVGEAVQAESGPLRSDEDLKSHYLDFYLALADVMVSADAQSSFMSRLRRGLLRGARLPESQTTETREQAMPRIRSFLQADIPSNFLPSWRPFGGSEAKARERAAQLMCGVPAMSKL